MICYGSYPEENVLHVTGSAGSQHDLKDFCGFLTLYPLLLLSSGKYYSVPHWIAFRWQIAPALHSIWSEAANTFLPVSPTFHALPLLFLLQALTFQMMPFPASLASSTPGSCNGLGVNCLLKDRGGSAQPDRTLSWEYSCLFAWLFNAVQL